MECEALINERFWLNIITSNYLDLLFLVIPFVHLLFFVKLIHANLVIIFNGIIFFIIYLFKKYILIYSFNVFQKLDKEFFFLYESTLFELKITTKLHLKQRNLCHCLLIILNLEGSLVGKRHFSSCSDRMVTLWKTKLFISNLRDFKSRGGLFISIFDVYIVYYCCLTLLNFVMFCEYFALVLICCWHRYF